MEMNDKSREALANDEVREALAKVAEALEQVSKSLSEIKVTATLVCDDRELVPEQGEAQDEAVGSIPMSPGGYEPTFFDSGEYVREHCSGYIYGLSTSADIAAIEGDSSLSYEEKQEAMAELDRLAGLYY